MQDNSAKYDTLINKKIVCIYTHDAYAWGLILQTGYYIILGYYIIKKKKGFIIRFLYYYSLG